MKYASLTLMLLTAAGTGYAINHLVPEQPLSMVLSFIAGSMIGLVWPK